MAKVNIGGLVFDATLKTDHNSKVTATSHPIESGASISDHAFVEPSEVSFEVGVSDAEVNNGTFGSGERGVKAFQELLKLQMSRKLIKAVTRLRSYSNMLITSVSAPDDYTTMNAFKAMIMLREIPVVGTSTVSVSERSSASSSQAQKSVSTNSGTVQASAPKQSVLKQANGMLGGLL
jgi:hypothetical protein